MSWNETDEVTTTFGTLKQAQSESYRIGAEAKGESILEQLAKDELIRTLPVEVVERIAEIVENA